MAYIRFADDDVLEGNIIRGVTSTAFSNNTGSISAFFTSSTATSSDAGKYMIELFNLNPSSNSSAEAQFAIAFGHSKGSGSAKQTGASTGFAPTKAVYSQFRNLLLDDTSANSLFAFGDNTSSERMYFITFNRARYKQGINAGNWELHLSSSALGGPDGINRFANGAGGAGSPLELIDDSSVSNGTTVNGHLVYNVVSGSETNGPFTDASSDYHYWGLFYPELGIIALNGDKVISGSGAIGSSTYGLQLGTGSYGMGTGSNVNNNLNEALFYAINKGKKFEVRAEEDVTSTHYFVRAKNSQFNYSTNPTYQTGSNGQLRHQSFIQNPQTFITTIGLYNDDNELLAIAKLSKPLLKNFERETTLRVKLDY